MAPLHIGQLSCPHCRQTGIVSTRQDDQKAPEVVFLSLHFAPVEQSAGDGSPLFKCLACDAVVGPSTLREG